MDRPRFAFRRLDKTLLLLCLLCLLAMLNDIFWFTIAFVLIGMAAEAILKPGSIVQLTIPMSDRSDAREKSRRLKEVVAANRLYEDADLTLTTLAVKLAMHPHDLSRIINLGLEKNFSDFINEFRVREIVRKMQDSAYDNLTLLGIAYESGFNSKTTFNRVFKEMTGKTPVEYKNSLNKEVPIDKLAPLARMRPVILRQEGPPNWVHGQLKRNYMFRNYLKIAWRNLITNKVYSVINVLGLAAGMAVAMLISFWIWDEVTYDKSFANHQQLAQVMTTFTEDDGSLNTAPNVCMPIAGELRSKYGGDFKNVAMATWNWSHMLTVGEKNVTAHGTWVEEKFPTMFSFHMLKGNIDALDDPLSIIINASMAKTLFGDAEPIGKVIKLDNKDNFTVAGVLQDFPENSTLYDSKYFLPWKKYITTEEWVKNSATSWGSKSWQCFAQLADNIDMDKETDKIRNVVMAHKSKADGIERAYLYPMDKWHLYSDIKNGKATGGRIQFIWLFSIIGVFVLLLACINFMNLSTARSEKRAKEVGIRKTIGSLRRQLIGQFLSESVLVAFVSFIFSIILVIVLLPLFNTLSAKNIQLPWLNPAFWLCTLTFTCITGLLSGSYPALYLSKFEPIAVLKGTFRTGRYASLPRKILVVVQFTFSIALIIGTVVVFKQIQFAKNRPINYKHEGLITLNGGIPGLPKYYEAIRNDLLVTGVVDNMAGSSDGTNYLGVWRHGFNWAGKNPNTLPTFGFMLMTEDFGKTIGWQLKEGRDFSKKFSTDSVAMILNEAAVKQIGMKKDILGENIQYDGRNYRVIGVIKDIIQESPYQPVTPMIYVTNHNWIGIVTIAMKTGVPVKNALTKIEAVFKKYNPSMPFNYTFNDEDYAKKFAEEQRVGKLATFFTILAIFISCLGLFGLASFVAEQRKKEIGVRKVLGASTYALWLMLSKEFAWLVIISCFVAIPVAWYYSNTWLQHYDYKTSLTAWVFILSGCGALVLTLLTVSFQSIKAALTNPVKSLRSE
jgi:ABC-type antimicrobial peptide transport system permease subunit/AraC-like DNA-binding protein